MRLTISKITLLFVVAATVCIAQSGCSKRTGQTAGGKSYITVKGSDTMVHLVTSWAEAFMKSRPDAQVSVTGGGSGTGIAALINGTTDICASSRKIDKREEQLAGQKGIRTEEVTVARDGIAVVVNPQNPTENLSMQDLAGIFTGTYTRWSQVGGPDQEIIVLSRESSSGTYVFFQEHVLNKKDYISNAKLMAATSAIIQSVSSDKWAIGYVGLGYALAAKDKVKILAIKADHKSLSIMPSEQTVKSGQYPIARALYVYVNSGANGVVRDFVNFCLSDKGQSIIKETGYITVQ